VQLSARVDQLTAHLKIHRKDYASTRGLMKVLSRRKSLMEYLKAHNRCLFVPYTHLCQYAGGFDLRNTVC